MVPLVECCVCYPCRRSRRSRVMKVDACCSVSHDSVITAWAAGRSRRRGEVMSELSTDMYARVRTRPALWRIGLRSRSATLTVSLIDIRRAPV